jgi:hypothetical protein
MSAINQKKNLSDEEYTRTAGSLAEEIEGNECAIPDPALIGELLRHAMIEHAQLERLRDDLELLRADYIARVAGMIRAIAAAGRSRDALAVADDEVAALDDMSVVELIETHRRVSARFRDAFKAGFDWSQRPGLAAKESRQFRTG